MAEFIYAGDAGAFKVCSKCHELKAIILFKRHPSCAFGVDSRCLECTRAESADWRAKNPKPPAPPRMVTCVACGLVGFEAVGSQRYCKPCATEMRRARDRDRKSRAIIGFAISCERCSAEFTRMHGKQVVCGECAKAVSAERSARWAAANPDRRREIAKNSNDKRRSTPQGHIEWTMRASVKRAIKKETKAGRRTFEILGYTVGELKKHLERQFTFGMSWANYGEWHIDHRIPLASFNYISPECPDFKRAWCITNLQPLWKLENLSKGAKRLFLV